MNITDLQQLPEIPPIFGPAKQVAYVVDDIDTAIEWWQTRHDVGSFLVTRSAAPLTNAFYRGKPAERSRVHIGFAYVGEMQLELIQLIGNTPGLYKEARDRGLDRVHHYAVLVDDFPAAYNWALDNGFDAVIDAGVDGLARMSYCENPDSGLILEIIESNRLTRPYFDGIEKRVHALDETMPIHEFELEELTPKLGVFVQLALFGLKKLFGRIEPTRRKAQATVTP